MRRSPRIIAALAIAGGIARAQGPAPAPSTADSPMIAPGIAGPAIVEGAEGVANALPARVQVVRFKVPGGTNVEVLGQATEGVSQGDGRGLNLGLIVGASYRLKLSNLPGREGVELYPVVEIVGHLHRPPGVDPGKFPIRIAFDEEDIEDVAARGRLVTKIVYLESPEQAIPVSLPKDEIPSVTLSAAENPIKVASALGRVMAIVRMGARTPSVEEMSGTGPILPLGNTPCPFLGPDGGRCAVPCGPARGTAPPGNRRWVPADEFLCDGGDFGEALHFGGDGGLRGIDPKDALIQFRKPTFEQLQPSIDRVQAAFGKGEITAETRDIEIRRLVRATEGENRPRVLPTNVVCIYAPRFASVRASVGPNEAINVAILRGNEIVQQQNALLGRSQPVKIALSQAPEAARLKLKASGMVGKVGTVAALEIRILGAVDVPIVLAGTDQLQKAQIARDRNKAAIYRERRQAVAIKTAESAVVTGRIEGVGEVAMAWKPQDVTGVEEPPNKPGLAVVKRASASEAEPGEEVSFSIRYRNMGNRAIASVSVVDSLLPRLEYVRNSAQGPPGTVFTAGENRAGSVELRWDLPGVLAPGQEGSVTFRAIVR